MRDTEFNRLKSTRIDSQAAMDKALLYAKYFLGQICASRLAYHLRTMNSVDAHYEIQNAKKNVFKITAFKDVSTGKPGEQLCQTLNDLRPHVTERSAKSELAYESCHEKRKELEKVVHRHRAAEEHLRRVNIVNMVIVTFDVLRKARKTTRVIRRNIRKGLKLVKKGSEIFTNFKQKLLLPASRINLLLSQRKIRVRSRSLTQSMLNKSDALKPPR
ncbi:MAG: hypothetical protein NZO16_02115 [Deltaproteobacteria bacterium]|nr:hypothetical protein [Deltaproteobacteria bacterium]